MPAVSASSPHLLPVLEQLDDVESYVNLLESRAIPRSRPNGVELGLAADETDQCEYELLWIVETDQNFISVQNDFGGPVSHDNPVDEIHPSRTGI